MSQQSTRGRRKSDDSPNSPLSIFALHKKTGADRALLKRVLSGVEPSGWDGGNPLYTLRQVEVALATKRGASSANLREQKLEQEIRKLTLANDQRAGTLIERAWVAERMARACSGWNGDRIRFEQQAPVALRSAARELTSKVGERLAQLAKEFEQ